MNLFCTLMYLLFIIVLNNKGRLMKLVYLILIIVVNIITIILKIKNFRARLLNVIFVNYGSWVFKFYGRMMRIIITTTIPVGIILSILLTYLYYNYTLFIPQIFQFEDRKIFFLISANFN